MNMRAVFAATLALAVLAAPWALALQEAKKADKPAGAPPVPTPAAEINTLSVFDGSWTCEGAMPPGPMGPGGKMKSRVKSKRDLGGFWQTGTVKGSMEGMPEMEGMFHITYEPGSKSYVMLWVDNMGGFSQTTSTGWEGDKLVFSGEGTMGGKKMMGRDTFTKNADGTLRHAWEMQMDGKWVPMGDETCRKDGGGK